MAETVDEINGIDHQLLRRGVTTTATSLRDAPRGAVLRLLPAGARLRILGDADHGFLPVVVREGDHARGYVDRHHVARGVGEHDDPDESEIPIVQPGGPTDDTAPIAPPGGISIALANEARTYIGFPYVFATHGPHSFDCSGLIHWVVLQVTGQAISPDSHAQFNLGARVDRAQLRPGDLLFYDTMEGQEVREGNTASHVGMSVGNGEMVNALNAERGVIVSDPFSPYFAPRFLGARRLF